MKGKAKAKQTPVNFIPPSPSTIFTITKKSSKALMPDPKRNLTRLLDLGKPVKNAKFGH